MFLMENKNERRIWMLESQSGNSDFLNTLSLQFFFIKTSNIHLFFINVHLKNCK